MKTLQELREAVENKTATVLTCEIAAEIKGKFISTIYFGYKGQDGIDNFIVGDVVSEWEIAENDTEFSKIDPRFANRAEYWKSYMTPDKIEEYKNKFLLFTADGRNTFIYAVQENEGAFSCSDRDRFVFFIQDEN